MFFHTLFNRKTRNTQETETPEATPEERALQAGAATFGIRAPHLGELNRQMQDLLYRGVYGHADIRRFYRQHPCVHEVAL